jgi:hypothetical protein
MKWYVETKNNISDRKGPIDEKTGWPTIHPSLIIEASNEIEAREYFELKFPNNVAEVFLL